MIYLINTWQVLWFGYIVGEVFYKHFFPILKCLQDMVHICISSIHCISTGQWPHLPGAYQTREYGLTVNLTFWSWSLLMCYRNMLKCAWFKVIIELTYSKTTYFWNGRNIAWLQIHLVQMGLSASTQKSHHTEDRQFFQVLLKVRHTHTHTHCC